MPSLVDAYNACASVLKPQRQGTCGLYCFWFATLLLNELRTDKKPVVYPRKHEQRAADPSVTRGSEARSLRSFAKDTLHSGQGELLTATEVVTMIVLFKWDWVAHVWGGDSRRDFITDSLKANRPVMFAHLAGGSPAMPLTVPRPDRQCGPHFSLIIDQDSTEYVFIEPNDPTILRRCLKTVVLESNEKVDDFVMDKTWVKPKFRPPSGAPLVISSAQLPAMKMQYPQLDLSTEATYDVSRRQALNNVLVAIT